MVGPGRTRHVLRHERTEHGDRRGAERPARHDVDRAIAHHADGGSRRAGAPEPSVGAFEHGGIGLQPGDVTSGCNRWKPWKNSEPLEDRDGHGAGLVRREGEQDSALDEVGERLSDAGQQDRVLDGVREVALEEGLERLVDNRGARLDLERACEQEARAVTDERDDPRFVELGSPHGHERRVAGAGDVPTRVDERPVEVEEEGAQAEAHTSRISRLAVRSHSSRA